MKNLYALLLLFGLLPFLVLAQPKHGHQWVLNRYNLMDFRGDSLALSVLDYSTNHGSGDYCTSICDEEGKLLFYSGGCFILNNEQ